MALSTRRQKAVSWGLGCLFAPVLLLFTVGVVMVTLEEPTPLNYTLHSTERFQAVHIPLTLNKWGQIFLPVTIDGKTRLWQFDTGSDVSNWPRGGDIKGEETEIARYSSGALGITGVEVNDVLSCVKIGKYECHKLSGYSRKVKKPVQVNNKGENVYLLNSSAFSQVVVTVDYQRQDMIIRNRVYDPAYEIIAKGVHALEFSTVKSYYDEDKPVADANYGQIVLKSNIGGKSVDLMLDTGYCNDWGLLLKSDKYKVIIPPLKSGPHPVKEWKRKISVYTTDGLKSVLTLSTSPVDFTINGVKPKDMFAEKASVLCDTSDDSAKYGGILGAAVLRNYRVTFDFPRQRLFLEPYAPGANPSRNARPHARQAHAK